MTFGRNDKFFVIYLHNTGLCIVQFVSLLSISSFIQVYVFYFSITFIHYTFPPPLFECEWVKDTVMIIIKCIDIQTTLWCLASWKFFFLKSFFFNPRPLAPNSKLSGMIVLRLGSDFSLRIRTMRYIYWRHI